MIPSRGARLPVRSRSVPLAIAALFLGSAALGGPPAEGSGAARQVRRKPEPPVSAQVRGAVALQIALEERGYSPGLVDGSAGPKTRLALAAFQEAAGLRASGEPSPETLEALEPSPDEAFGEIALTSMDLAEVDPPPRDWLERSRKKKLLYPSLSNLAAERAHTTERFLAALNPDLDLAALRPGDVLRVPAVKAQRRSPGILERIEIDLERKIILIVCGKKPSAPAGLLHCSIAANPEKAVPGDTQVATVVAEPVYTFDPAMWPEVKGISKKLLIPAGPRCPVGLRWIGLERSGVGIHGAPEPENIGKTGSHGCFRLTNWDAIWLAGLVQVGTPVRIVKDAADSSWPWRE